MKALKETISFDDNNVIASYMRQDNCYEFYWHYHETEYELTLISEGNGQRYIGDCITDYSENDLTIIPPGMPHSWVSNPRSTFNEAIVIQFSADILPSSGEFIKLKRFMESGTGYGFPVHEAKKIKNKCIKIEKAKGVYKYSAILSLLEDLRAIKHHELCSKSYHPSLDQESRKKMDKLHSFLASHEDGFKVPELAEHLHMSESTLRRFIKKNTGRPLIDYNNEIRIGRACAELIDSNSPIIEVAMNSGFENLSHFNRVFKKLKAKTPGEYRSAFLGKL